jgi:hypothetical protein
VSTPHPELETLAELADPGLATLGDDTLAAAREHAESCEQCAADLRALREVHDRLAALPSPALPSDVAANLDAAIEAAMDEPRDSAAESSTDGAAGTVTPIAAALTSKASGTGQSRNRGWRPGRPMPTSVAAGVAVLLFIGLGTAIALGAHSSGSSKSSSSASAGIVTAPRAAAAGSATSGLPVISSGTDYTAASFRQQASAVLLSNDPGLSAYAASPSSAAAAAASAPAAASEAAPVDSPPPAAGTSAAASAASVPSAAASAASVPSALAAPGQVDNGPSTQSQTSHGGAASPAWLLASPVALQACVDYLAGAPHTVPVLVDHATFNGNPATIITLHDPQITSQLDVYVIDDSINCESGNVTYAAFLHAAAGESATPSIG